MARRQTNTVIVQGHAQDPAALAQRLADRGLNVELVALRKFDRCIVICPSSAVAQCVYECVAALGAAASYSIRDNRLAVLEGSWVTKETKYLELPPEEESRRFLISPPLLPHLEWDDYGKSEEGPNMVPVFSAHDLSHLLWKRFGGFDSTEVCKYVDESVVDISEPSVLFQDIDNGVPAIVVDVVDERRENRHELPRTPAPVSFRA